MKKILLILICLIFASGLALAEHGTKNEKKYASNTGRMHPDGSGDLPGYAFIGFRLHNSRGSDSRRRPDLEGSGLEPGFQLYAAKIEFGTTGYF